MRFTQFWLFLLEEEDFEQLICLELKLCGVVIVQRQTVLTVQTKPLTIYLQLWSQDEPDMLKPVIVFCKYYKVPTKKVTYDEGNGAAGL